jgi:hypothetical protein
LARKREKQRKRREASERKCISMRPMSRWRILEHAKGDVASTMMRVKISGGRVQIHGTLLSDMAIEVGRQLEQRKYLANCGIL